jgi:2-(1,2-epoxy-1,2-dihydrophenyl)acetyl-CoA isomerase
VSAADAAEIGLVNRVVPADRLEAETARVATRLAQLPPVQLSVSKRLLNSAGNASMASALEAEDVAQSLMFRSADTAEAMLAFVQKRDPDFRGA